MRESGGGGVACGRREKEKAIAGDAGNAVDLIQYAIRSLAMRVGREGLQICLRHCERGFPVNELIGCTPARHLPCSLRPRFLEEEEAETPCVETCSTRSVNYTNNKPKPETAFQ